MVLLGVTLEKVSSTIIRTKNPLFAAYIELLTAPNLHSSFLVILMARKWFWKMAINLEIQNQSL